ncbi:MAG TPA: hypothetical protein VFX63_04455, partial [Pyrinomonadaceae bacterium]|nr:hypothetical protein [Pyrinomonadaceae bacterium]
MSPELRRVLAIFVLVVFAAGSALAQTEARSKANAEPAGAGSSTASKNTPVNPKYTTPKSPLDTAYGAKIAEYTTEKYFMTELVDHLPLSDKVPSPEKVLGYAVGTPNKLTYTKDLYRYYRELAKASPRVRVLVAPEKSEEGREQMLVLVSDEENLAKLDRYKEITAKLADPRKGTDA